MPERLVNRQPDLSLVIACYNEEAVLVSSMRRVFEILDHTTFSYEILFVDDCSRDRTRELILDIVRNHPDKQICYQFHDKNKGRGGTVTDGLLAARGDVAGYIDIDLELDARYIPDCVLAIQSGADVVTGLRIYRFYWRGLIRWILSHGYSALERFMLGIPLLDTETGYKFFRRDKILPVLNEIEDTRWFWDTEVMVRSYLKGYRIVELPCLFQRRFDKHSTVNPFLDSIDYLQKLVRFRGTVRALRRGADSATVASRATREEA